MRNIAICDDEPLYRERLAQSVRAHGNGQAAQLQLFHDRLYAATRARIPDRRALLFRMKEAWRYLGCSFADAERPLRRIRKAQDMTEYDSAVRQLFASCPVREDAGYRV